MKQAHSRKNPSASPPRPIFKTLSSRATSAPPRYVDTTDIRTLLAMAQQFLDSTDPISRRLENAGAELARLVNAGAWVIAVRPAIASASRKAMVVAGGHDDRLRRRATKSCAQSFRHLDPVDTRLLALARAKGNQVIAVIDRQRGVNGHAVLSLRCEEGTDFATWASVHRDPKACGPFTERDRRIVELFNSQTAWALLPLKD